MCGRFVSTSSAERIAAYFGAEVDTESLTENYNVAPTNDVYAVVASSSHEPVVRAFHWGLVPSWAKDVKVGYKMINARAETLADKPAFKKLFATRRLIVPMDGFYEWKVVPGQKAKQPMFIHGADGEPLAVAGLWSVWRDPAAGDEAPWLHSCTVITTGANELMRPVHDRMPAMLPASAWEQWLDPDVHDLDALAGLLRPAPEGLLTMHAVSTEVNNVRNKGVELIEPVEPGLSTEPG